MKKLLFENDILVLPKLNIHVYMQFCHTSKDPDSVQMVGKKGLVPNRFYILLLSMCPSRAIHIRILTKYKSTFTSC